jgi:hypothetical protein
MPRATRQCGCHEETKALPKGWITTLDQLYMLGAATRRDSHRRPVPAGLFSALGASVVW